VSELAAVVVGFLVTTLVFTACCVVAVVHSLRVRNRIAPSVRTPAPVAWLWSPRAAARLHRRLRRSVQATRLLLHGAFDDVAGDVEHRAVALDRQLVAADRAPLPARTRLVADLRDEVGEIEALNQRLVAMARTSRSRGDLTAVRERLDALDAALRELEPPAATA
jgi:hypothetical protein